MFTLHPSPVEIWPRSFRIAVIVLVAIIIVIFFFAVALVFLFVFFLVWPLAQEKIGGYQELMSG
jgi:hypothetical protein